MHTGFPDNIKRPRLCLFIFISMVVLLPACTILKKEQKGKPFIVKNSFEVKGGNFSKDELTALKSRLNTQLEDSAKINVVDKLFLWHFYESPAAFDTVYAARSAKNMQSSMLHMGYYRSAKSFKTDTIFRNKYTILSFRKFPWYKQNQQRVHVTYAVETGRPTLIDTISYRLLKPALQQLAMQKMDESLLKKNTPVTKAAISGEISRLVDLYRNNGYYKFTSEELKVQGDTSVEALTNISDDPFEQLQQLVLAQQKQDSPKIKLAVVLNPPADSSRLKQYYVRNIYILPDYRPGDTLRAPGLEERVLRRTGYILRFRNKRFRTGFLLRNMFFKPGDLYNQVDYYKTLNSFARSGAWQSVNIDIQEVKDSVGKIDLLVQLIPAEQYVFESSLEASYSANSNTNSVTTANAGNLLGTSANLSFTNRNFAKQGIKWTTSARAGVEFNLKPGNDRSSLINSNEIGLSNTFIIPRILLPFAQKKIDSTTKIYQPQTFVNLNAALINRINLFNLQSLNFGFGYTARLKNNAELTWKPINVEYAKLYNETDSFTKTLQENPFLRYSFNTALVAGVLFNGSYSVAKTNKKFQGRQYAFKSNLETSGLLIPKTVFSRYLRRFAKIDFDYSHSRSRPKSALILHSFLGLGIPMGGDTTLPFFKQYFGGGSNSMRGWPVRGIGRGSQPLAPYATSRFNDRTGDIQFETNLEYRYTIAQIIPNTLLLKGAMFIDAGNVWNLRNSKTSGTDSAQFQIKNFWRDLGVNAGTGFRLDFSYFVIRLDLGFRFKRPELAYVKNGWKIPALSFNDVLPKLFARGDNDEYRRWRYENFNFTIGINYPF
jgi:outer membrane protein insertion porin family